MNRTIHKAVIYGILTSALLLMAGCAAAHPFNLQSNQPNSVCEKENGGWVWNETLNEWQCNGITQQLSSEVPQQSTNAPAQPGNVCVRAGGIWAWDSSINQWQCDGINQKPSSIIQQQNEQLLAAIGDVNRTSETGYSILTDAAYEGNIQRMKELIHNGANINYQHADGMNPLYQFVTNGYAKNDSAVSLEMVKWMIEKGADYKRPGFRHYSLIHVSQNLELTKYLIALGMDIQSLTANNATTLIGSMVFELDGKQEDTAVQEYLIEHCVDLNKTTEFNGKIWSALDIARYYKRYKAVRLIENALKNPPEQCQNGGVLAPVISFYNLPETFDSENVNISIQVEAQGFGTGDIVLTINGSEVSANQENTTKVPRDGLKVKTFNVKLQNGLNEIRAYAYDESNTVKSEEIVHEIVAEYKVQGEPQLYAVAIGIDEFEAKQLNLKYAEADASLFGTTLFKRSKELFSKVNIEYMKKGEGTTKKAILAKLESLKNISANDFFVFYSATHGVSVDGKYYMIPSDIRSTDTKHIKENAISEDELRRAFRQIPTANKLLLFDTCYSGSINEKISKQLANSTVTKLNLTSMTAANSAQTALEGFADGHGIFTYVLSDALDGEADINHDGIVQSMELVNYANKMVPKEAEKYNHVQTPAYYQSGQVFTISKLRDFKGAVDLKPHYFKPKEVEKLIAYMNENNSADLNKMIHDNKLETEKTVQKIKSEAAKVEANKATETFRTADKKFQFGTHNFIFNDNSIFLDIKDQIKEHFYFTDAKGRHLIVFDFYSTDPAPRVVTALDTAKVSDIYMADRGDWYRVTLQVKSQQSYEHIVNNEGVFIKLKNNETHLQ